MAQLSNILESSMSADRDILPSPVLSYQEEDERIPSLQDSPTFGVHDTTLTDDIFKRPVDLGRLASANFSTDSLTEAPENLMAPTTPTLNGNNFQAPYVNRRYSNSSLNGSPVPSQPVVARTTRARPKSAYYMDTHHSISEDGSPVQVPISNTPRSRNSMGYIPKSAYIPNNFGPPLAPAAESRPLSNSRSNSPTRSRTYKPKSPVRRSSSPSKANPFNFKTQEVMMHSMGSNPSLTVKPAHRKGHKYKHSSVSMNLFQEPVQDFENSKQLLEIPDLFPIPNFRESIASINKTQKFKLLWSLLHFSLSILIFTLGFKFKLSAFSTLAHLIFYDSLGTILIVIVDIMSNFEVWNNSSIVYPFGLGRLEVLVAFGLSASLIMVGLDLISHSVEEFIVALIASDDSEHALSHHIHGELGHTNWFVYEFMLLLSITVTLITSNYILVSDKIKNMLSEEPTSLSAAPHKKNILGSLQKYVYAWAKNPTHLLTLTYSLYLLVYPIISHITETTDVNDLASITAALLLCYTGWRLVTTLGGILLCSYPYTDYEYHVLKSTIMDQIRGLDFFKQTYTINQFFVTKFNYKLFVVGLQIDMKGATSDDDSRLRFEIYRIVKREIQALSLVTANSDIEITIDVNRV